MNPDRHLETLAIALGIVCCAAVIIYTLFGGIHV